MDKKITRLEESTKNQAEDITEMKVQLKEHHGRIEALEKSDAITKTIHAEMQATILRIETMIKGELEDLKKNYVSKEVLSAQSTAQEKEGKYQKFWNIFLGMLITTVGAPAVLLIIGLIVKLYQSLTPLQ